MCGDHWLVGGKLLTNSINTIKFKPVQVLGLSDLTKSIWKVSFMVLSSSVLQPGVVMGSHFWVENQRSNHVLAN